MSASACSSGDAEWDGNVGRLACDEFAFAVLCSAAQEYWAEYSVARRYTTS